MKFGLCLPIRRDTSVEFNIELAKEAEALGFDSIWVSDHVVVPDGQVGRFSSVFYDPFVLLTAIASETESLKLGTSLIIVPYRNPIVVAKMISTLDVLSEGRVVFGVGPGWLIEEFEALGVNYKDRGKITNEYLKAIIELWEKDDPLFEGEYVNFSEIKFFPKPFKNRIPEIWVGGNSSKAISRAVELGSGWQPTWINPVNMTKAIENLKKVAEESNKDISRFTYSVRNRIKISKERNENSSKIVDNEPSFLFKGTMDQILKDIEAFGQGGVDYVVFDPEAESDSEAFEMIHQISEFIVSKF